MSGIVRNKLIDNLVNATNKVFISVGLRQVDQNVTFQAL